MTNPLSRWPSVTARAAQTLHEASGGRTFLGLGAGDSAVRSAGHSMASVEKLQSAATDLRSRGLGSPEGPDLMLAANGPRTLEMAGAMSDEVLYGGSLLATDIEAARAAVLRGATAAGRTTSPPLWVVVRGWVAQDSYQERKARDTLLASAANHAFAHRLPADLPTDVTSRIRTLQRHYSFSAHGRGGENPNGALVDELELRDVLAPRFGWVSTADDFMKRLRALAAQGVHGIVIPAVGNDPDVLIDRLGRLVLPEAIRLEQGTTT